MAGTAVLGRLTWLVAEVVDIVTETPRTKTLAFDVPGWPGHRAGQHVDVRLTAEDGYQAQRSYSIASAPDDTRIELTVERLDDGEVSPYLTEVGSGHRRPGKLSRAGAPAEAARLPRWIEGRVGEESPTVDPDQQGRPADVRDADVCHALLGTPRSAAQVTACSTAHVSAKSAITSQPS